MSFVALATDAVERWKLPDAVTRAGIAMLVERTSRKLARSDADVERIFADGMDDLPIAVDPAAANRQHYELPAEFFKLVLGPRLKYSCCRYGSASDDLETAEVRALEETSAHARLEDGQRILEMGCGWGSLSLWMAERLPHARITAVSNSRTQRQFIEAEAARRGLSGLSVITADMNVFDTSERFDRVVSVEMWEHMSNWRTLLRKVHSWLEPEGLLFLHVFAHRLAPYRFDPADENDWIARHFFTGGIMPSHGLIRHLDDCFALVDDWRWDGTQYRRTAEDWLARFDAREADIHRVMTQVYGADAALWTRRWRLFFLATAGLFGARGGSEWGVSHYLLRPLD
jgi:cyclopropane-fatty-acyl-phospholipid synthase